MKAEISFDLVMEDAMEFIEGTYRRLAEEWRVFIFTGNAAVSRLEVRATRWSSGAAGVIVAWPESQTLNRIAVMEVLGAYLGVTDWAEVRGPDSLGLR